MANRLILCCSNVHIDHNTSKQWAHHFVFLSLLSTHRREHLSDEDIKANKSKLDHNNLHKTLSDGPEVSKSVCNIRSCVHCVVGDSMSCSVALLVEWLNNQSNQNTLLLGQWMYFWMTKYVHECYVMCVEWWWTNYVKSEVSRLIL